MNLPEEKIFLAYMKILSDVFTFTRHLAWERNPLRWKKTLNEIADMVDAVHNVPEMLFKWSECDEEYLLQQLTIYDKKWASRSGYSLRALYEEYKKKERTNDSPITKKISKNYLKEDDH